MTGFSALKGGVFQQFVHTLNFATSSVSNQFPILEPHTLQILCVLMILSDIPFHDFDSVPGKTVCPETFVLPHLHRPFGHGNVFVLG